MLVPVALVVSRWEAYHPFLRLLPFAPGGLVAFLFGPVPLVGSVAVGNPSVGTGMGLSRRGLLRVGGLEALDADE